MLRLFHFSISSFLSKSQSHYVVPANSLFVKLSPASEIDLTKNTQIASFNVKCAVFPGRGSVEAYLVNYSEKVVYGQ